MSAYMNVNPPKEANHQSKRIDVADLANDELISSLIIRILNAPVQPEANWKPPADHKKTEAPLLLMVDLRPDEVHHVCRLAEKSLQMQETLIDIDKSHLPLTVVADLHGQVLQLLRIFRQCGSPTKDKYLFLGDYVDRGTQGIELMTLLFCLKVRYPRQVYLLRGNHEDVQTTLSYGFYEECANRWKCSSAEETAPGEEVFRSFLSAFNWLPLAAVVGKRIFCCHGGISPRINTLDDINKVERPSIIPAFGIATDLVWSDPTTSHHRWSNSHRRIAFDFGDRALEEFCVRNGLDLILRGHQISPEMHRSGYKMFSNRLITLFSAPNYQNKKNNACVIRIGEKLDLQFIVFRLPESRKDRKAAAAKVKASTSKGSKKKTDSKHTKKEDPEDTMVEMSQETIPPLPKTIVRKIPSGKGEPTSRMQAPSAMQSVLKQPQTVTTDKTQSSQNRSTYTVLPSSQLTVAPERSMLAPVSTINAPRPSPPPAAVVRRSSSTSKKSESKTGRKK